MDRKSYSDHFHEEKIASMHSAKEIRFKHRPLDIREEQYILKREKELLFSYEKQEYIKRGECLYKNMQTQSDQRNLIRDIRAKSLLDLSYSTLMTRKGCNIPEEDILRLENLREQRVISMDVNRCYYISIGLNRGRMDSQQSYEGMMINKHYKNAEILFESFIDPDRGKIFMPQKYIYSDDKRLKENFVDLSHQELIKEYEHKNSTDKPLYSSSSYNYTKIAYDFIALQKSLLKQLPESYSKQSKNKDLHDEALKIWQAPTRLRMDRPVALTELVGMNVLDSTMKTLLFPFCKPGEQKSFTPRDGDDFYFILGATNVDSMILSIQPSYPAKKINKVVLHRTENNELNFVIKFESLKADESAISPHPARPEEQKFSNTPPEQFGLDLRRRSRASSSGDQLKSQQVHSLAESYQIQQSRQKLHDLGAPLQMLSNPLDTYASSQQKRANTFLTAEKLLETDNQIKDGLNNLYELPKSSLETKPFALLGRLDLPLQRASESYKEPKENFELFINQQIRLIKNQRDTMYPSYESKSIKQGFRALEQKYREFIRISKHLELLADEHQKFYNDLYNEFNMSKPHCSVNNAYKMCIDLKEEIKSLDTLLKSINNYQSLTHIKENLKGLRSDMRLLLKDIYKTSMDWQIEVEIDYDHFGYMNILSGESEIAKKMAEIKQTPLYEQLKKAHQKFKKTYENASKERKQLFRKKENLFSLDDQLVIDYEQYCSLRVRVSDVLHTSEVDQAYIQRGRDMTEKVKKQFDQRREGGMTKKMDKLSCRIFYDMSVKLVPHTMDVSESIAPLTRWKVIPEQQNLYNVTFYSTENDETCHVRFTLDPANGILANTHAHRAKDQELRDNYLKNLSKETWSQFLNKSQSIKNEARYEHIKSILESNNNFPSEVNSKADLVQSIEEFFELKEAKWLEYTTGTLKFHPKMLSEEHWHNFTEEFSTLTNKRNCSDNKELLDLLAKTWLELFKDNWEKFHIPEDKVSTIKDKELLGKYIQSGFNQLVEDRKEILSINEMDNPKSSSLPALKKILECKALTPTLGELSQKAWDQYIKKKGLEYDKLPKEFCKALPASVLTTIGIEEVAKTYKADTGKQAAPIRVLIGVGFANPETKEALHGNGRPGEMIIYTREDQPAEFYRGLATHYGRRGVLIMHANPKEYKDKEIRRIGVLVLPSGAKCMLVFIDPINPPLRSPVSYEADAQAKWLKRYIDNIELPRQI